MKVEIIVVPYDSGYKDKRMGRGPGHLLSGGLVDAMRAGGHQVEASGVEVSSEFPTEVQTSFELYRVLAWRVRKVRQEGKFPLVLSGNCGSALGTLGGLGAEGTGIVWFDAHGDFNTPETTTSGFLDGMALAVATGRCWRALAATIPGFTPVPDGNVVHAGGRDFDSEEQILLESSGVGLVSAETLTQADLRVALEPALALSERTRRVYLHLDLDVLDPGEAQANGFPATGGLGVDRLAEAVRLLGERLPIGAACISAYDPAYDLEGNTLRAAFRLAETIAAAAGR